MKKLAARVGAVAIVAGSLALTPTMANAETEVVVFKDQITQPDTRPGGSITWPTGGGIRMVTQSNTSQDKATFAFGTGANAFELGASEVDHDVNIKSGGPAAEPGAQIYLDTASPAGIDTTLVYESVYGGDDVWLTNASNPQMRVVAPSCDGDPALATLSSDDAINQGHCTGGSGSAWHGSEDAWAAAMTNAGLDTTVVGLGESLGSGVKGNVLVLNISAGDTTWTFSKANAPAPEPVMVDPATRVQLTIDVSCRQAVFNAILPAPGPNEEYTQDSVGFKFVSAGNLVYKSTVEVGETSNSRTVTYTFSNTNVPRVKAYRTADGAAASTAPKVLVVDKGVNRRCDTVGS